MLGGIWAEKDWLTKEFADGYVFRRLDARAKVLIEYVLPNMRGFLLLLPIIND